MSRRNVKDIFDAIEQYAIAYRRLEQIQREVDQVETVPVPTPEPLDTDPQ